MLRRGGGRNQLTQLVQEVGMTISELIDKIDMLMIQIQNNVDSEINMPDVMNKQFLTDPLPAVEFLEALKENRLTKEVFTGLKEQIHLLAIEQMEKEIVSKQEILAIKHDVPLSEQAIVIILGFLILLFILGFASGAFDLIL
ncbi:MAG: hypothetical protein ACFFC7_02995 [Candidatus Hermodarchaeota archaeon]